MQETGTTTCTYSLRKGALSLLTALIFLSGARLSFASTGDLFLVGNTRPLTSLMSLIESRSLSAPFVSHNLLSFLENLPQKTQSIHLIGRVAVGSIPTGFSSGLSFSVPHPTTASSSFKFSPLSSASVPGFFSEISLLVPSKFNLQFARAEKRTLAVVGSNLSLMNDVDPIDYIPHVLSGGSFAVSKVSTLFGTLSVPFPRIAEGQVPIKNGLGKKGVVLGASTSAVSLQKKSTLPFLDRVSLSIYCALAAKNKDLNRERCDYEKVVEAITVSSAATSDSAPAVSTQVYAATTSLPVLDMASSSLDLLVQALSSRFSSQPVYTTKYVTEYVPVPGRDGRDGKDGHDGKDASDGITAFNNTQMPSGFGSYFAPSAPQASLVGISTIGYLKDTIVDTPTVNGGTANNFFLTNLTTQNAVFNGISIFNDSITLAGSTSANDLSIASSTLINSSIANALLGNSTTTNAFVSSLTVGSSSINSMTVSGDLFVGGTSTLATTTATGFSADNGFITNSTSTNLFTNNLVVGSSSILGNQVIFGAFDVVGTTTLGSDLFLKGNVTIGTSTSERLTINALVDSHIQPSQNKTYDLGSASFFWRTLYADSINVNTIAAASTTISGTSNNDFTINSDNNSNDTEDAQLIFLRGLASPNAIFRWNSGTDRFETNASVKIQDETPSVGSTSLTVRAGVAQGNQNMFLLKDFNGNELSVFDAKGHLGIGTSTPSSFFTIASSTTTGTSTLLNIFSNGKNLFSVSDNSNNGQMIISATGANGQSITLTPRFTSGVLFPNGSAGALIDGTGASGASPIAILGSGLHLTTGSYTGLYMPQGSANVGIGTTTPPDRLTLGTGGVGLMGTGNTNGIIFDRGSNNELALSKLGTNQITTNGSRFIAGSYQLNGAAVDASGLYQPAAGDISLKTGSTDRLYITAAGNIGLGTSTPGSLLTISSSTANGTSNLFSVSTSTSILNVLANGNIGIGTAAPSSLLHVEGVTPVLTLRDSRAVPSWSLGDVIGQINFITADTTGIGPHTTSYLQVVDDDITNPGSPATSLAFGTGAYNTPASEKMRITSTGNVGIGTTTPDANLTVKGSANSGSGTLLASFSAANVSNVFTVGDNGNLLTRGSLRVNNPGSNIGNTTIDNGGTGGSSRVYGFDGSGSGLTMFNLAANGLTFFNGGNVGIGTSSPLSLLHISGTTSATATIETTTANQTGGLTFRSNVTGNNVNIGTIDFFNSNSAASGTLAQVIGFQGASVSQGGLIFNTKSGGIMAERIRVDTTGNVGIGSTTPGVKLTVQGDGYFGGNLTATGTFALSGVLNSTQTTATNTIAGVTKFGNTSNLYLFENEINTITSATPVIISGRRMADGGLATAANVLLNPNSGVTIVGTTSNATVNGSTGSAFFVAKGTGASISDIATFAAVGNNGADRGGRISFTVPISSASSTVLGGGIGNAWTSNSMAAGAYLNFYTASTNDGVLTEKMRITASGDIGIGTTTPIGKLSIVGSTNFSNSTALHITSASGTPFFTVSSLGNTAIGTSSTDSILTIAPPGSPILSKSQVRVVSSAANISTGDIVGGIDFISNDLGNYNEAAYVRAIGSGVHLVGSVPTDLVFSVTASGTTTPKEAVRFAGTGNVGIGTSSPQRPLHVANNGSQSQILLENTLAASGNHYWGLQASTTNGTLLFNAMDDGLVATPRLAIQNSGNIGIGTTSPSQKLDVWGNLNIATGSTPLLFVDTANGKVGIGTASPTRALNVVGAVGASSGFVAFEGASQQVNIGASGLASLGGIAFSNAGSGFVRMYRAATNEFAISTNEVERLRIDSTGNVGIGTSTPGFLLTISSSTANGASTLFSISSSSPIFNVLANGNVGIGTTTPAALLEVTNGKNVSGLFRVTVASGAFGLDLGLDPTTGNPIFSGRANGVNTLGLAIGRANGNIGIGTTTPFAKLTVDGDAYFTGGITFASSTGTTTYSGNVSIGNGAFFYDASSTQTSISNLVAGNFSFDTDAGQVSWVDMPISATTATGTVMSYTSQLGGNNMFTVYGEHDGQGNIQNPRFGFGTTTPTSYVHVVGMGTAPLLTVGTTTSQDLFNILANGNIGVGTSTPVNMFDIYRNATGTTLGITGGITATGTNIASQLVLGNAGNLTGTKDYASVALSVNSSQTFNFGDLTFNLKSGAGQTVRSEMMRITSTGNVGIGTTTPTMKLSVSGGLRIGTNVGTDFGYQLIRDADGTFGASNSLVFRSEQANGAGYSFQNTTGTSLMQITNAGNVGIGSTTPAYNLVVAGNSGAGVTSAIENQSGAAILQFTGNSASNDDINFGSYGAGNANGRIRYSNASNTLSINTNGSARLTIDSAGNLGIGTTTPSTPLEVYSSGEALRIGNNTNTNTYIGFSNNPGVALRGFAGYNSTVFGSDSGFVNIQGTAGKGVGLSVNSNTFGATPSLYVNSSGSIGVGTTTPAGKLTVSSNAIVGGVFRVEAATGSDWFTVGDTTAGLVKFNGGGGTTQVGGSGDLGARFNIGSLASTSNILALSGVTGQTGDLFRADTNGTGGNQFVIKSNGNIGIGTTTPAALLGINGNAYIAGNVTATGTLAIGTSTLFTTTAGFVGIGSSSPAAIFNIFGSGSSNTDFRLTRSGAPTTYLSISAPGGANSRSVFGLSNNSAFAIGANGSMGIGSGTGYTDGTVLYPANGLIVQGNVGFGTTTPTTAGLVLTSTINNIQLVGAQISPNISYSIVAGNSGTALLVEPTYSNNIGGLDVIDFYGVRINTASSSIIQAQNLYGLYIDSATGATNNYGAYIGGSVGIGTSTPKSQLDVWSATSTSNVDLFRIASAVGGANNIKFRVDSDGDIFTDGATTVGTPADIAESYSAIEAVDAGTVVAFGTTTTAWSATYGSATSTASSSDVYEISGVRKAQDGYEAVGVVSTRPGLHLGADIHNGVPVALSGRVPVKVTNENGEVKRGDYLTVSKTRPGYAMKLTGEGRSLGRALSDMVVGNDKVMIYIESGYQKLDMAGKNATTTGMLTTGNVDLNANGVAIMNIKSLASASGAWSISEDGRIIAKVLCLDDVCIDKNQLTNILNSTGQSGVVAGTSTQSASVIDTVAQTVSVSTTTEPVAGDVAPADTATQTTVDTTPVVSAADATVPADTASAPVADTTPAQAPADTTVSTTGDGAPVI